MELIIIVILGLITASFIETLAYRTQRGISIITPPSSCDHCHTKLKFYEKIPVLSWIILRGKCRYCGNKIPVKYIITELILPGIYMLLYIRYKNLYEIALYAYLVTVMAYLSLLDIDRGSISMYDIAALYIGSAVNTVLSFTGHLTFAPKHYFFGLISGIAIVMVSFLIVYAVKKRIPMGAGDLLIIPAFSLFFGYREVITILIVSSTAGIFAGIFLMITGVVKREHKFPMIPYLTFGIVVQLILL